MCRGPCRTHLPLIMFVGGISIYASLLGATSYWLPVTLPCSHFLQMDQIICALSTSTAALPHSQPLTSRWPLDDASATDSHPMCSPIAWLQPHRVCTSELPGLVSSQELWSSSWRCLSESATGSRACLPLRAQAEGPLLSLLLHHTSQSLPSCCPFCPLNLTQGNLL